MEEGQEICRVVVGGVEQRQVSTVGVRHLEVAKELERSLSIGMMPGSLAPSGSASSLLDASGIARPEVVICVLKMYRLDEVVLSSTTRLPWHGGLGNR